jgi:transcriptional regulator with XRE-family HTH domain
MREDVRRLVGGNVRRIRLATKLTQAELAVRMGVDRSYISGIELGQRNPTIITLWHMARAMNVPVKDFFDDSKRRR